jgi:hypothetical protein
VPNADGASSSDRRPNAKPKRDAMEHDSPTPDELDLLCDLYLVRQWGKAAAVKPEFLPEAHRMCEKGWISRRVHNDDLVWEFTDTGLTALSLGALSRRNPADWN